MSVKERIINHINQGWSVGYACGMENITQRKLAELRLLDRAFDDKLKELAPDQPKYVYPRKRQGPLKAEVNVHPIYFELFGY